jgi:hypothetical protein
MSYQLNLTWVVLRRHLTKPRGAFSRTSRAAPNQTLCVRVRPLPPGAAVQPGVRRGVHGSFVALLRTPHPVRGTAARI